MQARNIFIGSFVICGLAYGGILASQLAMRAPSDLAEAQSDPGRSAGDAKFQPQDGQATVQARHMRDNPVRQVAAVRRAACPRCRIGD